MCLHLVKKDVTVSNVDVLDNFRVLHDPSSKLERKTVHAFMLIVFLDLHHILTRF